MSRRDTEDAIEQALMGQLDELGYERLNAIAEFNGDTFSGHLTGRDNMQQVVLRPRLLSALRLLNPDLPDEALGQAVEQLTENRRLQSLAVANAEVYALLKNGVNVTYRDETGEDVPGRVAVINWREPQANDWLAVRQFWVQTLGGLYNKRPDVVLFINGLPLVVIELKTFHRSAEEGYYKNIRDYQSTILQLFWYNAFIIISNGRHSRIGSLTSDWGRFFEWKRISNEREQASVELETMIEGTCEPSRLADITENFVLFKQESGGYVKFIPQNHQYLGVNNAIDAVRSIEDNQGRLGVFWHTQGSGKSYSMVFFSQKVHRKIPGNWTFVIITDREELDNQIYENFAAVGAVPSDKSGSRTLQAANGNELKQLLRGDSKYVFTLIQKFHTRGENDGELYPVLSERDDIIVMTDEAHRSQYAVFAANMRRALPNAAFIGFTGTPLIVGEEKTRQQFGEYVSVYDFRQSMQDGATVPLFYENRIPSVELTNDDLNADMEALLDDAMLDSEQEVRLEQEFRQEYQVITREPRQESIAQDIAEHFMVRGFEGRDYGSKGMVVCIDKLTAVRMLERVQGHWQDAMSVIEHQLEGNLDQGSRERLTSQLDYMRETDMAVVISSEQGEVEFFAEHGIDILPHRERIVKEELDKKFKDPENPFRLVFVCAMWMTGFDAPSCSTIYLDKPMRNHTLMQTIARANRVYKDKQSGLIVDYIGVFRNLEKALAIYGTGRDGEATDGELPVQKKDERIKELRDKLDTAIAFCGQQDIDLDAISAAEGYDRIVLKRDAVEALLSSQEVTDYFMTLTRDVTRLFRSILPDKVATEFYAKQKMLNILRKAILSEVPDADISDVEGRLSELLDESVATERYVIEASPTDKSRRYDLSQIDFDALREQFERGHKRTATEKLRGSVERQLKQMVKENRTRLDYMETFQQMLDEYNAGAVNVNVMFERLLAFVDELETEEKRAVAENLSEEELALFDLLTQPAPELTDDERETVKNASRSLLQTLKKEKLVLDWRKHQKGQASVRRSIELVLDQTLPPKYDADLYKQKCGQVYQHIFNAYDGAGSSVYTVA